MNHASHSHMTQNYLGLMRYACSVALLFALCSVIDAHAAGSLLRIVCENDAARAEITINGVFKGECPLDVQVNAGTVQIGAIKKIDASRERVFHDEFRIGEGVVKKVEVILEVGNGQTFRDCPDCPEMVVIPAGNFEMGSNDDGADNNPVHRVTIGKVFALGKAEVTQGQWRTIMGNNPSKFTNCGDDCPVGSVNWDDAQAFIQKLNAKTGKRYRLPSESEWEYACRAGGRQAYCGDDNIDSVSWYQSNSGGMPQSVASKKANAFGLYDMSGNVWEWVEDCWNDSYRGAPSDGSAWVSGQCSVGRVLRGGSWLVNPKFASAAIRYSNVRSSRGETFGFRLARMLP